MGLAVRKPGCADCRDSGGTGRPLDQQRDDYPDHILQDSGQRNLCQRSLSTSSRSNGVRSSTVTATVTKKDVGAVTSDAQEQVEAVESEYDVTATQGGVYEEMNETFRQLGIAMIIAIVISFAIVVVSFRSFLNALLIMVSLPLATIGAFLASWPPAIPWVPRP